MRVWGGGQWIARGEREERGDGRHAEEDGARRPLLISSRPAEVPTDVVSCLKPGPALSPSINQSITIAVPATINYREHGQAAGEHERRTLAAVAPGPPLAPAAPVSPPPTAPPSGEKAYTTTR